MKIRLLCLCASILASGSLFAIQEEPTRPKYEVTIRDEKTVVTENLMDSGGPVDPQQRIRFQTQGNFNVGITTMNGEPLHLGHGPTFMIDNRIVGPGTIGKFDKVNVPLPKTPAGKARNGFFSVWVAEKDLYITNTVELVPSRAKKQGEKRLMDTVLVSFSMENKSQQNHSIGMRLYMDTFVVDNDGCLFAAPTFPGKILNGIVLKDKSMPPY